MKPGRFLVTLSAIVGMLANAVAIASYVSSNWPWPGARPDPDVLLIVSTLLAAYGLAAWSALVWRWSASSHPDGAQPRPATAFALNGLAAYPVLAGWIYLLATLQAKAVQPPADRWLLSLALAWVATPFAALGMTQLGAVLGPIFHHREHREH